MISPWLFVFSEAQLEDHDRSYSKPHWLSKLELQAVFEGEGCDLCKFLWRIC